MLRSALALTVLLMAPLAAAADEAMAPEVVVSAQDAGEDSPRVAYNSTRDEYLAVWTVVLPPLAPRQVLGRRLDRYGRPLGPAFQISPTGDDRDRRIAAVAYDGVNDRYLVTYMHDYWGDGSDWDVRARFVAWNGPNPAWPEIVIAASIHHEISPRLAFHGATQKFLVTWWEDDLPGNATVNGSLVTFGSGAASPFTIASHRLRPDVADVPVAGNAFLVVYDNLLQVFGRLVSTDGFVGGEVTLVSGLAPASSAAVARCKEAYQHLIVWEMQLSDWDTAVYARFLWGDGTLDGDAFLIHSTPLIEGRPAVSCLDDGLEYLVVWEGQYSNTWGPFGVRARRVGVDKTSSPDFVVRPPFSGESGTPNSAPAVAGGKAGWLVAWEYDRQISPHYQDIRGRAVWQLFADGFEWGGLSQW